MHLALDAMSPAQALAQLARAASTAEHEFWPCSVSLIDQRAFAWDRLHGPRQLTAAYLLALAVAHGGRFVTFDRSVPAQAVPGAGAGHLVVL